MNPDQTNTKTGAITTAVAAADLTGKRSFLGVLGNSSGVRTINVPTANGDPALYQLQEDGASGAVIDIEHFAPHRNFRVPLKGTCDAGDKLCLADTGTAADRGKLRKVPATAGTYVVIAIAEETGVDGQHVLCRPQYFGTVTV